MNRDKTSARTTPTCAGRVLGALLFLVLATWPQAALADRAAAAPLMAPSPETSSRSRVRCSQPAPT